MSEPTRTSVLSTTPSYVASIFERHKKVRAVEILERMAQNWEKVGEPKLAQAIRTQMQKFA
jgi:hypothetical protein